MQLHHLNSQRLKRHTQWQPVLF